MNKKVLVAGLAVAAVVAGGLYFSPGDGGQGFVFRIPKKDPVIVEVPNVNLEKQDLTGSKFQIRDGVGYEGQARSTTNDDAVAVRKPVDLEGRKDFRIDPNVMYQGDGQKNGSTDKETSGGLEIFGGKKNKEKPVLGSGVRTTPSPTPAEEPSEQEFNMAAFNARKAAQHAIISDKIQSFESLTWQYRSGLSAITLRGCVNPESLIALENYYLELRDGAFEMEEKMGFISNGYIDYRFGLGEAIDSARESALNFGRILDTVDRACISLESRETFFDQLHLDDVNLSQVLGELKDEYDVMMNNALY